MPVPAHINITSRHPNGNTVNSSGSSSSSNSNNKRLPEHQALMAARATGEISRNFRETMQKQQQHKRRHIGGEAGKGPPPWAIAARPGRTRTAVALLLLRLLLLRAGLATLRAAEERMRRRGLVAAIAVAAEVVFLATRARLIGGGPGKQQTAVVIRAGAAVEKTAGEGGVAEGASRMSSRPTRFRTRRSNSGSARCAGGGSARRRWRNTQGPARRCSRPSER